MYTMYGQDFSSRQILSTCIQVGNVVLQRSGCGLIVIPAKQAVWKQKVILKSGEIIPNNEQLRYTNPYFILFYEQ